MIAFRDAVVADLKTNVTGLKTCETHAGRFDLGELKRIALKSPAVLVSILGFGNAKDVGGELLTPLQMSAFVVTRDQPSIARDSSVLAIVKAVSIRISENDWGLNAQRPQAIKGQNLYSGKIDKKGVALWAITWRQEVNLGNELDEATLNAFVTLNIDHSLAPGTDEPAAIDDVTLEQ